MRVGEEDDEIEIGEEDDDNEVEGETEVELDGDEQPVRPPVFPVRLVN